MDHTRLGYRVQIQFFEQGQVMGYVLEHPDGGRPLGLRLNPERARAAAGFDYSAIGVPGKETIEQHTGLDPHAVTTINDPRESAERRKQVAAASSRNEIT